MAYQEGYLPTDAELQNAIKISLAAKDGSLWANSATDEYGQLSQQTEFAQEINTAARIISAYSMNGGDVSKIPQSLQYLTTTDWANRIDAAGSGKWRDVLPLLAVAAGGLAGVGAFGGVAAGAGGAATGTEAAGTYGAAGEFAGASSGGLAAGTGGTAGGVGSMSLAEQSAAIGTGSTAGTAAGTGVGTGTAGGAAATPSMWDSILGGAKTAAGAMPWGNLAGSVLEYMGQGKAGDTAQDLMRMQIESDQWRPQQGRYFEPLYEAATKGIGDTAYGRSLAEQTARQSSAQGYNMSGNMLTDIAKSLNTGTTDYMRALTPLATGRGESAAPGQFAPSIMNAQQGQYGAVGYGLGEIMRNWPTNNQQTTSGFPAPKQGTGLNELYL